MIFGMFNCVLRVIFSLRAWITPGKQRLQHNYSSNLIIHLLYYPIIFDVQIIFTDSWFIAMDLEMIFPLKNCCPGLSPLTRETNLGDKMIQKCSKLFLK